MKPLVEFLSTPLIDLTHAIIWHSEGISFLDVANTTLQKVLDKVGDGIIDRIRIFHPDDNGDELHIWRVSTPDKGSNTMRIDGLDYGFRYWKELVKSADFTFRKEDQLLSGTSAEVVGTYLKFTEEKGINYEMPLHWLGGQSVVQLFKEEKARLLLSMEGAYQYTSNCGYSLFDYRYKKISVKLFNHS